jgi:hypothetical protein
MSWGFGEKCEKNQEIGNGEGIRRWRLGQKWREWRKRRKKNEKSKMKNEGTESKAQAERGTGKVPF